MEHFPLSAGGGVSSVSEAQTGPPTLPMRAGSLEIDRLIDLYMAHYAGRDVTRLQRLSWWRARLPGLTLDQVSDDHIHAALEALANQPATYFAGNDAHGKPIYKAKRSRISPATINRYGASIAAVFTWAIKRRIAPKGWVHPCRAVERREENNEQTRYLSDAERQRLLDAVKAASWPRLYLLVLMALTTGARKGELQGLRWSEVDLERGLAHVGRTKNGDPKVLPLVPAVVEELRRFAAAPTSLVFLSPRRPDQPYAFEPMWKDVLRVAKIKSFRFHDLRHSCASMLAQSGATLLEIGDLLGHRQLQVTKRYSHLTVGHKAELVNRVLGQIQ
ncbi:tyrosine-type recombinase/integrase [Hydrogenophaga sp. BPS33]|uniref:tyrosine-type recombinase/integrase n=1 Tax=Hydrogenophaga sp. BPS33 TaxID=2651974 RepID=UPI0013203EEA|nr:site-specific integrase [Hydrogenophaga sp. BPS33]QHE86323.1 tyrosine-type recombinase/integrase [Hydrogenophaga sp. BPS33]